MSTTVREPRYEEPSERSLYRGLRDTVSEGLPVNFIDFMREFCSSVRSPEPCRRDWEIVYDYFASCVLESVNF